MLEHPVKTQLILAVFPPGEDRLTLHEIVAGSGWQLQFASTFVETRIALDVCPITVILSDSRLLDGHSWKDVLRELEYLPNPPSLIVTDRLADDALWVEVLNLGGYDVLAKPFHPKEVLHALTSAWNFRTHQAEHLARVRRPRGLTAELVRQPGEKKRAAS